MNQYCFAKTHAAVVSFIGQRNFVSEGEVRLGECWARRSSSLGPASACPCGDQAPNLALIRAVIHSDDCTSPELKFGV